MRLRGLTWRNPRGVDPLVATADAWRHEYRDIEIVWEALPWIAFERQLLASFEGRAEPYDLVMLDHPWLGTLVSRGYLQAWEALVGAEYIEALQQCVVAPSLASYVLEDQLWALPVDAACHAGLMRRDLVDEEDLPADWNALARWAEARFNPSQGYPFVLSVSSVLGHSLFLALMEAQGTPAYRDARNPTCDRDAATHVLETLVDLLRFTPPGSTEWGPWDIYEHMVRQDDVGYCPQIFGFVNYFDVNAERRFKLVGCPAFYGRPATPILGGVGLAITQQSEFPTQAAAYARFVMSETAQRDIFPAHRGQPATYLAWRDRSINTQADDFYTDMLPMMRQSFMRPRYDGFHAIELQNAEVLQRLWEGQATIDQTVQTLVRPHETR